MKIISKIIRKYFMTTYYTDTYEIEKFNDILSIEKNNTLSNNYHKSWCDHLTEVKPSTCDVLATYDLSNHIKIPTHKRKYPPTSSIDSFHARFSVLSALLTPNKLRIYNYSHRHRCKSVVHSGSMIDITIPTKYFIVLHSALVHCGTPSWFVESGYYHTNTRSSFQLWKNITLLLTLKK